jgi:hypothetical protein
MAGKGEGGGVVAGMAVGGGVLTGFGALLGALSWFMGGQPMVGSICLVAAALAFGLTANAVLRD